jgi:hypothetical protein
LLQWDFNFFSVDTSVLTTEYVRLGAYYLQLASSLTALIKAKDVHLSALIERLGEAGGSYRPRKGKEALREFDEDPVRQEVMGRVKEMTEKETFAAWWGERTREEWKQVVVYTVEVCD